MQKEKSNGVSSSAIALVFVMAFATVSEGNSTSTSPNTTDILTTVAATTQITPDDCKGSEVCSREFILKTLVTNYTSNSFCPFVFDVFNDTEIEMCCCNVTRASLVSSRRKRTTGDNQGDKYGVESEIIVTDSSKVTQEYVLKIFKERVEEILSIGNYGFLIDLNFTTFEEIGLSSSTSRLEQILIVVFGTIGGLLFIITTAYCVWFLLFCRLRKLQFQETKIPFKQWSPDNVTDAQPRSDELTHGRSADRDDDIVYRRPKRQREASPNYTDEMPMTRPPPRRWSYLFGAHDEQEKIDESMPHPRKQVEQKGNAPPTIAVGGVIDEHEVIENEEVPTVIHRHESHRYQELGGPDGNFPNYPYEERGYFP